MEALPSVDNAPQHLFNPQEHEYAVDPFVQKLSKNVLRDFYQTFRLSQGLVNVQLQFFALLADQHERDGTQPFLCSAIEHASHSVGQLLPPRQHAPVSLKVLDIFDDGFKGAWAQYEDIMQNTSLLAKYSSVECTADTVLEKMLLTDSYYQENPRPNRSDGHDPHESVVREYILGDRLPGSDQLYGVREQLRKGLYAPSPDIGSQLSKLAREWEAAHPSQIFMPQPASPLVT